MKKYFVLNSYRWSVSFGERQDDRKQAVRRSVLPSVTDLPTNDLSSLLTLSIKRYGIGYVNSKKMSTSIEDLDRNKLTSDNPAIVIMSLYIDLKWHKIYNVTLL